MIKIHRVIRSNILAGVGLREVGLLRGQPGANANYSKYTKIRMYDYFPHNFEVSAYNLFFIVDRARIFKIRMDSDLDFCQLHLTTKCV